MTGRLAGLRERAVTLAGGFVALTVGVALMAGAGVVLAASSDHGASRDAVATVALSQAGELLVLLAVIGAFVTMFIVASTFAFSVAQRRRELARFRLVGATPAQVSRMVVAEAAMLAVVAGLAGALLAAPAVPALLWFLARFNAVPSSIVVPVTVGRLVVPAGIAAAAGVVVAVGGAASAARRAGRVSPAEALRDASADRTVMTRGRWIAGILATAAGVGMLALIPVAPPAGRLPLAMFVSLPLVVAVAMLAPVVVVPVTAVVTAPLDLGTHASGLLARQNLTAAVRRTASNAAPILVMVGIAGSLLAGSQQLTTGLDADARVLYHSDLVLTPALDPARVAATPGVAAAATILPVNLTTTADRATRTLSALAVTPGAAGVLGISHVTGSLGALHGDTVALARSTAGSDHPGIGGVLAVRLGDGTTMPLRVVALYDGTPLSDPPLVPFTLGVAHQGRNDRQLATTQVRIAPGVSIAIVRHQLDRRGTDAQTTARWLARTTTSRNAGIILGAQVLAAFALLYTFLAVANTTIISFTDRKRDFARLRVTGASRAQLLRMVTWEALAITVTGIAFGAAVITVAVGGLWQTLHWIGLQVPLTVPWLDLTAIVAACAIVVVSAAIAPAALLIRRQPSRVLTATA